MSAILIGTLYLFGNDETPCGCTLGWKLYRVGKLNVRECRECKATWTERHRAAKENQVIL